jgi:AcrR family transcriptional regulator
VGLPGGTTRAYDASGRQAAAQQRRLHVAEVAWRMFAERGWNGTRMADVAREADVSVELVAKAFGGKQGLLMAAFRRGSFGGHANLQEAFAALDLASEPEPSVRVRRLAHFIVATMGPMVPMLSVVNVAADQDEQLATLLREARRMHLVTCAEACELIASGPVEPRVVDEVGLLSRAETYALLVVEREWSLGDYTDWVEQRLRALLLTPAASG